jgi:hypothetical protein
MTLHVGRRVIQFVMREKHNRTTISVRLAADEEVLVRRMARKRRTTVTAVIREAVNRLAASEERKARPFDLMSDLIGSVHGERDDLSQRTGDRFAAIVREKAARRR